MQNKRPLWAFPLLTQTIFSILAVSFSSVSANTLQHALLFALLTTTLPAFVLAVICVKVGYFRHQLFPITFWAGVIAFLYGAVLLSIDIYQAVENSFSLWENTLAIFLFAFAYALGAMIYAMIVLRPFLPSKPASEKPL